MSRLDDLIKILNCKKNVFIQMHNSPDPDAIATAFALKELLNIKGIESTICYRGQIVKYSTLRMIELLDISIFLFEDENNINEDDYIILVDAQKGNSNITKLGGCEVACIDHHPIFVHNNYMYKDIRWDIGACSTILASYYIENNMKISENVATALLYGIKMDTLDLSRGVHDLDLDMFYYLYKLANKTKLAGIQRNTLEYSDLTAYSSAIKNIRIYNNIGFINVGFHCSDVLLACISDFIMSLKEVNFVVVYCEKEKGIKISIRNESEDLDAGIIINRALKGYGDGGGHRTMAGGIIPSENIVKIVGETDGFIENLFLRCISEFKKNENFCG